MKRDIWTVWDWKREPEAPRGWEHPERMVVLADGLDSAIVRKMPRGVSETEHGLLRRGALLINTETPAETIDLASDRRHPEPRGRIPALRVEHQADLSRAALRALCGVQAHHRAIVISPREELDLDPPTCPTCGGQDAVLGSDAEDGTLFCREHGDEMGFGAILDTFAVDNRLPADLVIVRGSTGPDAWPMHPAWVRKLRDACAEAGVAFAFLGWGDFIPEDSYPPEINGCSKRRHAWMDGGCKGPRPEPEGLEGTWWGTWVVRDGRIVSEGSVITDFGAIDEEGTFGTPGAFVSMWTGWHNSQRFCRVGAERSGRLLDGREHLDLPEGPDV